MSERLEKPKRKPFVLYLDIGAYGDAHSIAAITADYRLLRYLSFGRLTLAALKTFISDLRTTGCLRPGDVLVVDRNCGTTSARFAKFCAGLGIKLLFRGG